MFSSRILKDILKKLVLLFVVLYPLSIINFLLFHILVEGAILVMVLSTNIVGYNTYYLKRNCTIRILEYGFWGYSIFLFLHTISFPGMNIVNSGKYFYAASALVANVILGVFFTLAILSLGNNRKLEKIKGKLKKYIYLYIITLIGIIIYISKIDIFIEINPRTVSNMKIVYPGFLIIIWVITLITLYLKREQIRKGKLENLTSSFLLMSISFVLIFFHKDVTDIYYSLAHIIKILGIYYLYKSIILKSLKNPAEEMFLKLNKIRKKLVVENLELENELKKEKKVEQELKKYKMAMEQSTSLIVILDIEGQITYVNKQYLDVTSYKKEDVLGEKILGLRPYDSSSDYNWKELENALKNKSRWIGELFNRKKNGSIYWEEVSFSPVENSEGKVINYLKISEDITEKREMKIKLKNQMEELKRATKAKDKFLTNMSHEIRTPMNGVIGATDLLLDTNLNKLQNEYTNMIKSSATSLLTIINDILDFYKIENGKFELEEVNADIYLLIEDIAQLFLPRAMRKGIELEYKVEDNISKDILLDEDKVKRVLINLVGNALKFTNEGEILINVVKKGESKDRLSLLFLIKDTGVGIAKEKQKKIFQDFVQEDSSISRKYGGTGLGLSISNKLVKLMGGNILVESESGEGSTFSFILDCKIADKGEKNLNEESLHDKLKRHKKEIEIMNKKVLIVEDNDINRKIVEHNLLELGIKTINATDGLEAIKKYNSNDVDMILMDIQMPNLGGFDATKRIINSKKYKRNEVPIIALTAHAVKGYRDQCIKSGMNDYISKPIDRNVLSKKILKYLFQENIFEDLDGNQNIIDLEDLRNDFGKAFLKELVEDFLEYFPEILKNIDEGIESEDYIKTDRNVLKIKDSITNFKAWNTIKLTKKLEDYITEKRDIMEIKKVLKNLKKELHIIKGELKKIL